MRNGPTEVSPRSLPSSREAPDHAVHAAVDDRREGVGHAEVRVLPHAQRHEQVVGAVVQLK